MGEVWRAEHVALYTTVAVKLVSLRDRANSQETLARFTREAQAAALLRSPNVVQIFDHGIDADTAYIAMELLVGESLHDRLTRVGRLSPGDAARIVAQVARALERAHAAGIVHRDVKPQNVFLCNVEGRETVKVLDFGIAKTTALAGVDAHATQDGFMVGTPSYMSPEQVLGNRRIDGRSDLWQLGVVVFQCLVGQLPFASEATGELLVKIVSGPLPVPSRIAPVPPGFDGWFEVALCRDVDRRFQDARSLAHALCRVLVPTSTSDALADDAPAWSPVPAATASGSGALGPAGPGPVWASSVTALRARGRLAFAWALGGALVLAAIAVVAVVLVGRSAGDADTIVAGTSTAENVPRTVSAEPHAVPPSASTPAVAAQNSASAAADATSSPDPSASTSVSARPAPTVPRVVRPRRPEEVLGI